MLGASAGAAAPAASTAVAAVAGGQSSAVTGVITCARHQGSPHQRSAGHAVVVVLHQRARALMSLSAILISSGDEEHGRTVRGRASDDAEPDADRLTAHRLLRRGSVEKRAVSSGAGGGARHITVGSRGALSSKGLVGINGKAGIDHRHELPRAVIGRAVVQAGCRREQIQLESVDHVAGHKSQRQGRDIAQLLRRIVWLQGVHHDVIRRNPQPGRNALREVTEDLSHRDGIGHHERIIERVSEANLD